MEGRRFRAFQALSVQGILQGWGEACWRPNWWQARSCDLHFKLARRGGEPFARDTGFARHPRTAFGGIANAFGGGNANEDWLCVNQRVKFALGIIIP